MKVPAIPASVGPYLSNIKSSSRRMLPYWIGAAATALISIIYARLFAWSESLAFKWHESHPAWSFVVIPFAMIASTCLAQFFSPLAAGSGIPQLLAAVEVSRQNDPLIRRLLSLRMIPIKMVGSCICVAGGGITGREGPMLQISAAIFHQIQKFWPKLVSKDSTPQLQPMILAGGAAGLASAFNTPLGGVIFAVEELAKVHISHIRTYVFHSVIIAGLLAQAVLGNYIYFGKIELLAPSTREMAPLILASALIGILGALFAKGSISLLDWRSRSGNTAKLAMTFACGLGVAVFVNFFGRQAIGSGREVIVGLLSHSDSSAPLGLGLARGFGNLLTYSGGVIGGIFAPALSTGAALGSWMSDLVPGFNHQVWILAGMVAFLTGLTRTPFTSLILVLEMTDTHNVIITLMLAAIIAQSAARLIDHNSFYEHMSYRIIHGKPPPKGVHVGPEL